MICTEKEAAGKWCPLARIATPITIANSSQVIAAVAANRSSGTAKASNLGANVPPKASRCIGSACMAWTWHDVYNKPHEWSKGYCGAFALRDDHD